jgi:hypothetical protein
MANWSKARAAVTQRWHTGIRKGAGFLVPG